MAALTLPYRLNASVFPSKYWVASLSHALSIIRMWWQGLGLRVVLILWGLFQDAYWLVPYTDVDYWVYSDAAALILEGHSPYLRHTYRYTPLLAYAMTPNLLIHKATGKLVLAAIDLIATKYLLNTLHLIHAPKPYLYAAAFLFNPLVFNLSTRGSADIISSLLVFGKISHSSIAHNSLYSHSQCHTQKTTQHCRHTLWNSSAL